MDAPPPSGAAPTRHSRWRRLVAGGLAPRDVGWASGIGAAMGVAPIPGLQMATCGLIAWRWRLNLPVMLLASNVSFGPLMVLWAVVAVCLGRALRTLDAPWSGWGELRASFAHAGDGLGAFLQAIGGCVGDWLVGSILLMPALGLVVGVLGWGLTRAIRRSRPC
jgi:hypothetical protein